MCLEGDGEINKDDDFFYGDVVSFNPNECIENVLSDVCFRFNTAQREWNADKNNWIGQFRYDEITSDDYDYYHPKPRQKPVLVKKEKVVYSSNNANDSDSPFAVLAKLKK